MTFGLHRALPRDGARRADVTSASIAMSTKTMPCRLITIPCWPSSLSRGPIARRPWRWPSRHWLGFQVSGLETTVPFHARLLQQPEFARAEVHTRWVEENLQAVTH